MLSCDLVNEGYAYPTTDGRPHGETDLHRKQIDDLLFALEVRYQPQNDVYVSGKILTFYEEGNARDFLSPDVMVAMGIPKRPRDNYLIWKEGKAPDLVLEITSLSTKFEDIGVKRGLYECLGVKEFAIFDPLKEYLEPRLRLYRLAGNEYFRVAGSPLQLEALGLELRVVEGALRLYDPTAKALLPTREETVARLSEKEQAVAERDARIQALEAKLRRLSGDAS